MAHALRTSRLVLEYRKYLDRSDTLNFVTTISQRYSVDTLAAILRRGDCETRRASALALSMIGNSSIIELLGRHLSDRDRGVRLMADDAFRAILLRDASPSHNQQLLRVMHLNDGAEFAAALTPAIILTGQAPRFAEAHHQLAIAYHSLDDFASAESAYRACLWHCRFHYMAWAGLSDCRRAIGDNHEALKHLETAVQICPDFEAARIAARSIEREIRRRNSGESGA